MALPEASPPAAPVAPAAGDGAAVTPRHGPLHGIRIVDLSTVVMGPYATQILGDLGADIVKVEPPEGDTTRQAGHARHPGMGAVFLTLARNKRSVALDLKHPLGRQALGRLVAASDVLVHNLRPDAATRLGLDHATLREANPQIVVCAARGFSARGPYRDLPAYDDMIQGLSGTAALMGQVLGEPAYVPMIYADKTVGLFVANAIQAALIHRLRSGRGQAVEVPMFEVMTAFTLVEHLYDHTFEPPRSAQPGYVRVLSRWRRPFRTADGHVCTLPYTNRHFERFFAAIGRPELMQDPRFADMAARLRHVDALYGLIAEVMATRGTAQWLALLREADIPCAPILGLDQVLQDPHLQAVGFFDFEQHPTEGRLRHYPLPLAFSDSPLARRSPAPRLGEHGREVLQELGFDAGAVDELVRAGVLRLPAA
jgi:crotonobetainyl-CoA:carnitine CoA-transferase CaiB-like acyl-CoA transferase